MTFESKCPTVSVIVPVYNVEKYLERCLNSIINQSYTSYEIICINDCSPDACQSILDKFQLRYPDKIRVFINEQNIGLGKTREKGIEKARGKWLLFIDSDDYISNDYIATYVFAMKNEDYDVLAGGYIRDIQGKYKIHKVVYDKKNIITYPIACAKMFRKQFIMEHGIEFSDIRCGEDIYFSLQLLYYGAKQGSIDYTGYYYYFNSNSITGSMNYDKKHEQFVANIFKSFFEKHDVKNMSLENRWIVEYSYIANMVNALISYGHGCGIKKMNEKYEFFMQDLKKNFPEYKKNPIYGWSKQKNQLIKVKIGVAVTIVLHKLKLDKLMFMVISLI